MEDRALWYILPEWKKWQETLTFEKRSPLSQTSETTPFSPGTSDWGKQVSQLGLQPQTDQMWRGREVGHVWQSGLSVFLDKWSWLIWRLPTPPRLTCSLHNLHSRESMGCNWRLYMTLEVSIWNTHILRCSKAQLPRSILKISEKRTLTIQARATQEQPKAFWDGVWRDRSSKEKAQLLLDLIRVSFGLGGRHKNHELEMSGALAHASWCFTKSLLVEGKPFIFLKPRLF